MTDNITIGYTKEEYYRISDKQKLPKRCPIFGNCCRAFETRYKMGIKLGGSDMSFEEFIDSHNQKRDTSAMIRAIEQVSWDYTHDVLTSVQNACPEVTLFEPEYLPFHFRQSAFGNASWCKDARRFEAEAKHYSECAEFSEYAFHNTERKIKGESAQKGRKRSHISKTMKFEIFHRDNFSCYYCRRHKSDFPKGVHLTLDHKVPYIDGGDDSFENLVTACSDCNGGKSNKVIKNL